MPRLYCRRILSLNMIWDITYVECVWTRCLIHSETISYVYAHYYLVFISNDIVLMYIIL